MPAGVDKKPSGSETDEGSAPRIVKTATDLQRIKLEKLMSRPVSATNPDKPAFIPEKRKEKQFPEPPEFIRNVMGSSAGAGSGEFHIYRHIRRRETARQQHLDAQSEKDRLDEEFQKKLEDNERLIEEKIAKKRAKRQKKKNAKKKKGQGADGKDQTGGDSSSGEEEEQKPSIISGGKSTLSFRTSDDEKNEESADES